MPIINTLVDTYAVEAWRKIFTSISPTIRDALNQILQAEGAAISDEFYRALFKDPLAKSFLAHETVNKRLRGALLNWLVRLFSLSNEDEFLALAAHQLQIGAIHARIKLPAPLLSAGIRVIRASINARLKALPLSTEDFFAAQIYVFELLSLAEGLLMSAYACDLQQEARGDEAYRIAATRQNLSVERERQRAALSEWVNDFLFRLRMTGRTTNMEKLANSEFGMWFKHKGKVLFDDMPEARTILDSIEQIDQAILPQFKVGLVFGPSADRLIGELRGIVNMLRYMLNDMFERLACIDQGFDAITGLYSRLHLGAVLMREQQQHLESGHSFGVLIVRIDKLDAERSDDDLNNILLRQVSTIMLESTRVSDHLFRYGNSEFLVLAVETTRETTLNIATALRSRLMAHEFFLRGDSAIRLTVSIGAVQYDGHPDYMELLRRAKHSVVRASVQGGNQVVAAWEHPEP